jgi:hypothetical protein
MATAVGFSVAVSVSLFLPRPKGGRNSVRRADRAVFHGGSRGSRKISLGSAIPYHSTNGRLEAGRPQDEFHILVIKILNSSCGQPIPDWLLGRSGFGCPQGIDSGGKTRPRETLHEESMDFLDPWTPSFYVPGFELVVPRLWW